MRTAFFCATPYQSLIAINIMKTKQLEGNIDLFVLNHFNNSIELAQNIKMSNYFSNVKHIDCIKFTNSFSKRKHINYLQKIKAFFCSKKIVSNYINIDKLNYDNIYYAFPDMIIQLIIKEIYRRNPNVKSHRYEAGTGGYLADLLKTSKAKRLYNKITSSAKSVENYDSIMMFEPELFSGEANISKVKIPFIDKEDKELTETINKVFGYKEDYEIKEKIIFLEQPMDNISGLNEQINEIMNKTLKDDYIIKLHPRSNTAHYIEYNVYPNNSLPWEVICLNNDVEDKVLISYHSTASFSNKIIFDSEPIVIFLYEMEELKKYYELSKDLKEFVYKFRNTYRDPSRVLIAKNITELKKYMKKIIE